jgi:hypothetical protein
MGFTGKPPAPVQLRLKPPRQLSWGSPPWRLQWRGASVGLRPSKEDVAGQPNSDTEMPGKAGPISNAPKNWGGMGPFPISRKSGFPLTAAKPLPCS